MAGNLSDKERVDRLAKYVGTYPDFPKKGIIFRDVFPIMAEPAVFADCISLLVEHVKSLHPHVDVIIGLDARGFIFGPLMAQQMGIAFAPIRKKGKLPGETISVSFSLEYGSDVFELQKRAVQSGQKVVIVDDLLATGGTMLAACKLLQEVGAEILECITVIELSDLKGRDKLPDKVPVFSLLQYAGE